MSPGRRRPRRGAPPEPLPSPITTKVIQGERVFGVYLAVAPFDAPELDAASDLAAVAIYFERRPDALAWIEAFEPPPLGIAMVELFCAERRDRNDVEE